MQRFCNLYIDLSDPIYSFIFQSTNMGYCHIDTKSLVSFIYRSEI